MTRHPITYNPMARERVQSFLSEILNVDQFPLTVLDRPIECKIKGLGRGHILQINEKVRKSK